MGGEGVAFNRIHHFGIVGALAAWCVTQGVYRFDRTVADAAVKTPSARDLPTQLPCGLPEWRVYIKTPGRKWAGSVLHGFLAHLDWELGGGDELCLLLDVAQSPASSLDRGLIPLPLILGDGSLAEVLTTVSESGRRRAAEHGRAGAVVPQADAAMVATQVAPLMAPVSYLCAENAEVGDGVGRARNPEPKRTMRVLRLFPPNEVAARDVGVRLGAALRRAQPPGAGRAETQNGGRARPSAHIRRSRWHAYRIGEGRLDCKVRRTAPAADPDVPGATVRPVN